MSKEDKVIVIDDRSLFEPTVKPGAKLTPRLKRALKEYEERKKEEANELDRKKR